MPRVQKASRAAGPHRGRRRPLACAPAPAAQDKKGKGRPAATISKKEPCESFFNFFR
jgi:hypothetical protein